jgi:hypothetical protein
LPKTLNEEVMAAWEQLMHRWEAAQLAYISASQELNSLQSIADREIRQAAAHEALSKLVEINNEVRSFIGATAIRRDSTKESLIVAEMNLAGQSVESPEARVGQPAARAENE